MISAFQVPVDVCAGLQYKINAPPECQGSKITEWIVLPNPLPTGVTPDDVAISNSFALNPLFTFPVDGTYYLVVKCCD